MFKKQLLDGLLELTLHLLPMCKLADCPDSVLFSVLIFILVIIHIYSILMLVYETFTLININCSKNC